MARGKIIRPDYTLELFDKGADGQATLCLKKGGKLEVLEKGNTIFEIKSNLKSIKYKNELEYFTELNIHKGIPFDNSHELKVSKNDNKDSKTIKIKTNQFDINKRFKMVEEVIRMVVKGYTDSIVICGKGGAGKSYTLFKVMNEMGMVETSDPFQANAYVTVKGALTTAELYKFIHDNRNATIVFDDCDAVFQNETTQNILKAVLDTTNVRRVTYLSPYLEKDGYESSFIFEGKIIFISNRSMDKIPEPIQSRAMLLDLDFNTDELIQRMRELAPIMVPNLTEDQAKELIDFISDNREQFKSLSLRTLLKSSKFIEAGCEGWRDLVQFAN